VTDRPPTDATDVPFFPPDVRPRRRPLTSHPTLHGSGVTRLDSMQGQDLVVILDGRPGGNAEGSPLCQLAVLMDLGKVSTPHVHDETDVYVRLEGCGPQGVLTLYGDRLQHEEWLFAGGTLWLPPGVPHVAIYPRFHDASTAVAIETRTTPDPFGDVRALPALWGTLARNLDVLELYDHVDAPPAAGDAWRVRA
jgi:uncharacterized RmlC-like cupin family protein